MDPRRSDETERTYDLADGVVLPDLGSATAPIATARPLDTIELDATYYDTEDLSLLRQRITLRRRRGGDDAGWHLKLPAHGAGPDGGRADTRHELHWPLGRAGRVPAAVRRLLTPVTDDAPLAQVARLRTTRTRTLLADEAGQSLATVCEDHVAATVTVDGQTSGTGQTSGAVLWREVEVEAVQQSSDAVAALDAAETLLLAAGARPAVVASKLRRALQDHPALAHPEATADGDTLAEVVLGYAAVHLGALRTATLATRLDAHAGPGVHDLRVAARRLRTALLVARRTDVLADPRLDAAIDALRSLGRGLGPVRDQQVVGTLLQRRWQEAAAGTAPAAAPRSAEEVLDHPAHRDLIADLAALLRSPHLGGSADAPAAPALSEILAQERRRVRKRADRARRAAPADRDDALHSTRKAAKRLRYCAELALPALGDPSARVAHRAKRVQRHLGRQSDAVALAAYTRRLVDLEGLDAAAGWLLRGIHDRARRDADRDTGTLRRRVRALRRVDLA